MQTVSFTAAWECIITDYVERVMPLYIKNKLLKPIWPRI